MGQVVLGELDAGCSFQEPAGGWRACAGEVVFHAPSCLSQCGPEGSGVEGVAGGPPECLDQAGPPVAQRGVGEQAGDLPVEDAAGEGALGGAHPFLVAEGEAGELLCPRLAGGAVAPRRPGLASGVRPPAFVLAGGDHRGPPGAGAALAVAVEGRAQLGDRPGLAVDLDADSHRAR